MTDLNELCKVHFYIEITLSGQCSRNSVHLIQFAVPNRAYVLPYFHVTRHDSYKVDFHLLIDDCKASFSST